MNGPFGYGPVTAQFVPFTPFDTARPIPTDADKAEAERRIAHAYDANPKYCRVWLADHRPSLVESMARMVLQDRLVAQHNTRFTAPVRRVG